MVIKTKYNKVTVIDGLIKITLELKFKTILLKLSNNSIKNTKIPEIFEKSIVMNAIGNIIKETSYKTI